MSNPKYHFQGIVRERKLEFPAKTIATGTFTSVEEAQAWALQLVMATTRHTGAHGSTKFVPSYGLVNSRLRYALEFGLGDMVWEVYIIDWTAAPVLPAEPRDEIFPGEFSFGLVEHDVIWHTTRYTGPDPLA